MKVFVPRFKLGVLTGIGLWMSLGQASAAWAGEDGLLKIDTGDTAWLLISSALVLCMTLPGLA